MIGSFKKQEISSKFTLSSLFANRYDEKKLLPTWIKKYYLYQNLYYYNKPIKPHLMKKLFISILTILCSGISFAQTTATDFTTNDCAGVSHTLFSELDAGKIIVAAFVMPCGSCSAPSLAAYNAVQSYAVSNPNTVYFYLVDDAANTTCASLTSWGNNNAMPLATKFSDAAFSMDDYGTPGMPKIIVLGGANHGIVYNQNSGVSTVGVQTAINGLLSLGTPLINEIGSLNLKVIPNPVVSDFQINYSIEKNTDVLIELFSLAGESLFQVIEKNQSSGNHSINLANKISLKNGMYVIKLTTDNHSQSINFIVEK